MKRFTAVLVGLALAMTARSAAARELAPAVGLVTGKDVTFDSVELVELTGTPASCDDDGVLDTGESARVRVTLRNSGTERLERTSMTLSSQATNVSFPEGQTEAFPASEPGELTQAELTVKLSGASTLRQIALNIAYRDEDQLAPEDKTHTVTYGVNTDELPQTSTLETVEALQHPWTVTASPAGIAPWARQPDSTGANGFFHGPANNEPASLALVSPPLQVSTTQTFRVIFQQRYAFETNSSGLHYDGAVIELSADDGQNWVDIGTSVNPTYNATLETGRQNPLEGRRAYGGKSTGYPAFTKTTLNLGTTYAGKTVRLRFRIGTDESTGDTGWDLDDLQLEGVVNKPFTGVVAHRSMCLNRAPVATVKPVTAVNEGTRVTLVGSATDVNANTTFIYTWKQLGGPAVELSDSAAASTSFTAPLVDADTELTFQLVVGDGELESEPATVNVLVRNVPNKRPVARAGNDQSVSEGSGVTLNGSESKDPEGLELLYTWTQVEGPTVKLMPAGPKALFNAPEVDEETAFTFRLEVTDAEKESGEDTITVRVTNKVPVPQASGGCAAGPDGGVSTMALLLLPALGFALRRPRGRSR